MCSQASVPLSRMPAGRAGIRSPRTCGSSAAAAMAATTALTMSPPIKGVKPAAIAPAAVRW